MLFNSLIFLIFGALFFSGWIYFRKKNTSRWIYICLASFFFYGWWDWRFLFLILLSGLIDYFAAWALEIFPRRKKFWLMFSLIGNLGTLGIFKYSGFLAENIKALLSFFGYVNSLPQTDFSLILPVGISFYTFQSMSYTIDVCRGELKPVKNIFHFFAYLAMFPQLVAGPIVRAKDLIPQLMTWRSISEKEQWNGTKLIVFGYFKKTVIADNIAPVVSEAFGAATMNGSASYWWLVMTAFALQIYGDFSGYSDIARGLAKWMGYNFRLNFNHPYAATSIRDFWGRWHISLSTWFRDYVYIPLGGARKGVVYGLIFMWATMLVSGVWHGAAWGFIVWGALHAFYLSVERILKWPKVLTKWKLGKLVVWVLILMQVWTAWVFFRAESLMQGWMVIRAMYCGPWVWKNYFSNNINWLLFGMMLYEFVIMWRGNSPIWRKSALWQRKFEPLLISLLIVLILYQKGPGSEFIYFQF